MVKEISTIEQWLPPVREGVGVDSKREKGSFTGDRNILYLGCMGVYNCQNPSNCTL